MARRSRSSANIKEMGKGVEKKKGRCDD